MDVDQVLLLHDDHHQDQAAHPAQCEQLAVNYQHCIPRVFFGLESFYFCELGAHARFRNPTSIFKNPPFPRKYIYGSPQILLLVGIVPSSLLWMLHPQYLGLILIFLGGGGWHKGAWSTSLDLMVVNNSYTANLKRNPN